MGGDGRREGQQRSARDGGATRDPGHDVSSKERAFSRLAWKIERTSTFVNAAAGSPGPLLGPA
jgi:hypothetical protein